MTYFRAPWHPTLCGEHIEGGIYRILNVLEDVRIRINPGDAVPEGVRDLVPWAVPGTAWVNRDTRDNDQPQIFLLRATSPTLEASVYHWGTNTWGPPGFLIDARGRWGTMSIAEFLRSSVRLWASDEVPYGPNPQRPLNVGPYFLPPATPADSIGHLRDTIDLEVRFSAKTIYDFLLEEDYYV